MIQTVSTDTLPTETAQGRPARQQFRHRKVEALLVTVVVLYVAIRIWSLWSPHLWGDEVFTFSLSRGTWITLIKRAGLDMAHPPLFYFLLKPWIYIFGNSMVGLRILPVAFAIVTIVPLIALGRKLDFRWEVIILTLFLMTVNNYLILYSYYLRSYSLLLFLAVYSQALFVDFLRSPASEQRRRIVWLSIMNILFVYTHYFAWLIVIAEYLWVAVMSRRQLRLFTIVMAMLVLSYVPWIGVLIYVSTQVPYTFLDQISWYRPPGLYSLFLVLRSFNGGFDDVSLTLKGSLIVFLILLVALIRSVVQSDSPNLKNKTKLNSYALLAWLSFFPIIVSVVASKLFTWVWEPRYVIVAAGSYLLLISAAAFRLRSPYTRVAAVVFLLGWCSIAGFTDHLADVLHGPNGPSYWLAQDLAKKETRSTGPISVYGLSPYAEQGLGLALNLIGEKRFTTIPCSPEVTFRDNDFWIAVTEHDPFATARVKELSSDPQYEVGEPIYAGQAPQRHMVIPVRRKIN